VKWKLEIEMKLLGKMELEFKIEFFSRMEITLFTAIIQVSLCSLALTVKKWRI